MTSRGESNQRKDLLFAVRHRSGRIVGDVAVAGGAVRGMVRQCRASSVKLSQGFKQQRCKMNFEKSADTKIIESVLAEANIGDTITYATLSKAIGRDVRTFAFASLRSARHGLLQSKKYVFGVQSNVGLIRLDDDQIVESTEDDRRRMQRAANRSIKKLGVVDYAKLSDEKKKQHIVASATMGALSMFSGKNAQKKIEQKVTPESSQLAIGETLKLFS